MNEGMLALSIPIIGMLVTGLILVTYFFLKSRERQLLIDKGLSAEQIKQFFESKESKKDQFRLMKVGIIAIAFGVGLGFGLMMEDATSKEYWVPFALFTVTGIGFVIANLIARKLEKDNK